jgi:hypothetical protein
MTIVLCPGIHDAQLTQIFWNVIRQTDLKCGSWGDISQVYTVEDARSWGFSPLHVLDYLNKTVSPDDPLILISFSAGVVGAIGAAWAWHHQGGKVSALLALDGWGVPLYGPFPIYRLSHDYFTHWSSQGIGMGQETFYADPSVGHLDLWRSPDQAWGWWERTQWSNAAAVICQILQKNE